MVIPRHVNIFQSVLHKENFKNKKHIKCLCNYIYYKLLCNNLWLYHLFILFHIPPFGSLKVGKYKNIVIFYHHFKF